MRRSASKARGVQRDVHGPLDRVLDSREPEVHLASLSGSEDLGYGWEQAEFAVREVGLGQKCLLGEGAMRAEIAN